MVQNFDEACRHYENFLRALGLGECVDAGLASRCVAEMMVQWTRSVHAPEPSLSLVAASHTHGGGSVSLDEIQFYSFCLHHFVPFWGTVHISYVPQARIAGLGGFVRVVDFFSRKPQIQERLCQEIADFLDAQLKPRSLRVRVRARQMCLELSGNACGVVIETQETRGEELSFEPI